MEPLDAQSGRRKRQLRRGPMVSLCVLATAALGLALAASPAGARQIDFGFADPKFGSGSDALRDAVYDESVQVGASYARVVVNWSEIGRFQPLDPADPEDPAYRWEAPDNAIRAAGERGLRILVTIHKAPPWAEGPGRPLVTPSVPEGTWDPDPDQLRDFAIALARRYSGSFVPEGEVDPLPRVGLWEPWNEPNLTGFLTPQWSDDPSPEPLSPDIYRGLLDAVWTGVKWVQPDALVLAAATGPHGDVPGGRRVHPVRFYRDLLCLPRSGAPSDCPGPVRFDVFSHHPINAAGTARAPAPADHVALRELPRLRKLLRAAERNGTVLPAGRRRELWATEIWWESIPPANKLHGAPNERGQARNLADALRLLWRQRVPVALLFQVRDDAEVGIRPRTGWATGVTFSNGRRKAAWRAVRFPFVADRLNPRRVRVWTRSPASGKLRIQVKRRSGGWRTRRRMAVDEGEVVQRRFRVRRRTKLRARVGGARSIGWRVPARRRTT